MRNTPSDRDALFLGLDSSTQALKATLIDAELRVVREGAVRFDDDLPEFRTEGGAHRHPDGLTVTSPALMWVAALDLLLERMKREGWPRDRVAAVSGSGQQHGSVWLRRGARAALRGLRAERGLREQLAGVFALEDSPIWMDSSTGRQCAARERAMGGAQAVAGVTGSRAYERFTGNQIARIFEERPGVYAATDRIALVSSFVASLLAGDYAPIDVSDGSGMNLMDIRARKWHPAALECTGPGLERRLGPLVPSHTVIGPVSPWLAARHGFRPDCQVVAFSGDNPNSLAGLRLRHTGDIAVSMGTSDTVFGSLADPKPSASEGHIFVNPVEPEAYMAMVVHKNGSLTREQVRDRQPGGSWEAFETALRGTPPGNEGRIGFYITEPEITPPIMRPGDYRFDAAGRTAEAFDPAADARGVVESQFLSMRLHCANIGLTPKSILATGGASANASVVRIVCDVFGVPVFVGEQPNSAALGAAYRALHGWTCRRQGRFVTFAEVVAKAPPFRRAAEPDPAAHAVYTQMLPRYAALERRVLAG
ncbi:MAG: carbohydrate kinase [Lentisphaerae bacterium]|nr:carbohydrate kinase [Lentisphaerota bacterium]